MTFDGSVRPAGEGDLAAVSEIYDHYIRTSHATFDVEPMSAERRRVWFEEHPGGRHRGARRGDRRSGDQFASSGRYRPRPAYDTSVETSVYHQPSVRRPGRWKSAVPVLFDVLEGEDVHRAFAGIGLPNDASIALHERFGFRRVAHFSEQGRKFGRYWDVDWYERPVGS